MLGASRPKVNRALQALIAHEIDNIQSGDMAVNLRVLGWVTGLSALYDAGAALWRSVSSGFSAAIARTPWAWRRMAIGLFPLFLPARCCRPLPAGTMSPRRMRRRHA